MLHLSRIRAAQTTLLLTVSLGCSAPGSAQSLPTDTAARPSVILILMDDMGYGDLASYGAPDVRTPNIDRLAREGVRLTDAYANGAVCTPTRVALITGRYQQRTGLEWVLEAMPGHRELGLAPTGASLPALLKGNGYATALFGKWHLGWKPEYSPNRHGFDEFYGFLSGAHSYYTNRAEVRGAGGGLPDLFENARPVEATGYLTDVVTQRAVEFISRHAAEPFFLEVAYNAVHWPFERPDSAAAEAARSGSRPLLQMPDDPHPATRQDYTRILERADYGVGEILAALDSLGLSSSTLVIFTSDNGGEWLSRNAPLTNRKGTLWEGGIRVPLILRWPDALPAGQTSSQVAITMDLTASILAATNTRAPAGHRLDGINILPVLRGETEPVGRDLYWRVNRPDRRQRAIRSGGWKLLQDADSLELFDLRHDPGERSDLAAQHPDVVSRLRHMVDQWEAEVNQKSVSR